MTSLVLALVLSAQVRLTIEAPDKILRPGRAMNVRFTIENAGTAEAKVDEPDSYLEGLEIWDFEGKVIKALGKTKGITRRSPILDPGGFLGRTVDVGPALPVADGREGFYRLKWTFGDVASNEVRVLVVRDYVAKVETNHGDIEFELLPELAPNHVLSFVKLARSGFYKDTIFHRIIPGFMMQGGQAKDGSSPVAPLAAEFSDRKHVFGTVSAARTNDPNSATTQFFICFGTVAHLDKNYSVFGQVVSGLEVVKEIEKVKSDHNPCKGCGQAPQRPGPTACCGRHHEDRPLQDVVMKSVVVYERKN